MHTRKHIAALDGLRGIAALMVLAHHLEMRVPGPNLFAHGYVAVDLFFILSGFVMGMAYDERLRDGLPPRKFFEIRMVRIYPLIALGTVLAIVPAILTGTALPDTWALLLLQLLFIPALWRRGEIYPINGLQWSLFFELFANVVHALFARRLTNFALIAIAALSAAGLVYIGMTEGKVAAGYSVSNFIGGFARIGFGYCVGLLIFRLHRSGRLPVPQSHWMIVAGIPIVGTVAAQFIKPFGLGDLALVLVVLPVTIILAISVHLPPTVARIGTVIGMMSYPLYALQAFMIRTAAYMFDLLSINSLAAWIGFVPAAMLIAYAVHSGFDVPVRKMFSRRRPSAERAPITVG